MRTFALVAVSVALFLVGARLHGRQLRLEREAAGYTHVTFRGVNPPFVEQLWRAERVRFWSLTVLLALLSGALLAWRGAPLKLVGLAVLAWAPTVAFLLLGAASAVRNHGGRI